MVSLPRVNVSFVVLIDLYISLCQKISSANLVNNSIGLNGKQGNKEQNAFWNISDKNYHLNGMKTSSPIISDNHGVNKAKIGNEKFEIENT